MTQRKRQMKSRLEEEELATLSTTGPPLSQTSRRYLELRPEMVSDKCL